MRVFVVLALLTLSLTACSSDPAFNRGKVVDKFYQPEKDWTALEYSLDCGLSFDGKYDCGSYKLKWVHHHQDLLYQLRIENCNLSDKNGNTIVKKDGSAKCYRKWIDVDPQAYSRYHVGVNYVA